MLEDFKSKYIQSLEEFYEYYPSLKGMPLIINVHCLPKEHDKKFEETLYDLSVMAKYDLKHRND